MDSGAEHPHRPLQVDRLLLEVAMALEDSLMELVHSLEARDLEEMVEESKEKPE